jgi:hypothetical protein
MKIMEVDMTATMLIVTLTHYYKYLGHYDLYYW